MMKQKFHKLHVTDILPAHTIRVIESKQFKLLSPIYHDLDARAD